MDYHVIPDSDSQTHTSVGHTCQCNPEIELYDGCVLIVHQRTATTPQQTARDPVQLEFDFSYNVANGTAGA